MSVMGQLQSGQRKPQNHGFGFLMLKRKNIQEKKQSSQQAVVPFSIFNQANFSERSPNYLSDS